ncbi:LysR family transcriptional regulator [Fictibacillus sp. UD]|uniref:LysR family transcriptional regulator n=1 Tax=Fictibacillus sp. UD TaxID=3038777 RepID=UPI003745BE22
MDINQLQAFDQVVRHGSFSKAARMMDISQPAISIRIKNLEEEIGGELFKRGGNKLEITVLGRTFLPFAQQALATLYKGMEQSRLAQEGKGGTLAIGTLPTLATHYFSATLTTLQRKYPNLGIIIHTGHNQELLEMLYEGYVKLCLMTYPFFNAELRSLLHIKEPLVFVTHCNHPLAKKGNLELAELKCAEPYLLVDWSLETKRSQKELIPFHNLEVPPQTALDMIKNGVGVSLLTETMVSSEIEGGELVRLTIKDFPMLYRECALVQLKRDTDISLSQQTFIQTLSDTIRKNYQSCEIKVITTK